MRDYSEIAAAVHRVRCRYSRDDLPDLLLNRLVDETRRELERLECERPVPPCQTPGGAASSG